MAIRTHQRHPLRRPDGTLPDISIYPQGVIQAMPSFAHERARQVAAEALRRLLAPESLVAVELAVLRDPHNLRNYVQPDLLVVLGGGEIDPVYGVLRRQYRLWDEEKPPDLVLELASPSTYRRDVLGKREDYAAMGVREYVQFDPLDELLEPALQVYVLRGRSYQLVQAEEDGGVRSTVLEGYVWVRQGIFLRLRERAGGALVPIAEEDHQARLLAEEQAAREAEARRAAEEQAAREAQARRAAEEQAARERGARLALEARIAALERRLGAWPPGDDTAAPDSEP
jgi:Uma2 family endonuclease